MSNYPNKFDTDVDLPPVNDNITEIGAEAINALREAVFNIEQALGLNLQGSTPSLADRLNVSIQPDGYLYPSALALPEIYNSNVASTAGILESKLSLDHPTQDLYNDIVSLTSSVNANTNWISAVGSKINPHIAGTSYRHELSHIDVAYNILNYFKNRYNINNPELPSGIQGPNRDNTNAYTLFNDINNDYIIHQKSDGYIYNSYVQNINTLGGGTYPSNFAHTAGGIYLNSNSYNIIPNDVNNLQKLADFIDTSSMLLLGSRVQNLFTSGISRVSRSTILDGYYGPNIIPSTQVTTYSDTGTSIIDDVLVGDDIVIFNPGNSVTDNYQFDSQFSQVKIGDLITINYGSVETQFLVKEKRYIPATSSPPSSYAIRIDGKNLFSTGPNLTAFARIDRPDINYAKYGVLAVSSAQIGYTQSLPNNQSILKNEITDFSPSLIVSHPRGAVVLGNDFDASSINDTNYNLYLVLYPNGDITKGTTLLAIDITGNKGTTPGKYTLDSIVESTNNQFRARGINYRFNAFSYNGQFGIILSDSYNNAGFSVIAGELDGIKYKENSTKYPKNIIRYDVDGNVISDPLGFGAKKANVSGPEYTPTYSSAISGYNFPTKLYLPLRRNNYYVDGAGVESDKINPLEPYQQLDEYRDGYWTATIFSKNIINSSTGRVEVQFEVPYSLADSSLAKGKTLVVQPLDNPYDTTVNYGRYIISNVQFLNDPCTPGSGLDKTLITIYDSIQGNSTTNGINPPASYPTGTMEVADGYQYALYFNNDSVTFNKENAFDDNNYASNNYKRHFEIYVNPNKLDIQPSTNYVDPTGNTFSLERGRMNIGGSTIQILNVDLYCDSSDIAKINIVRISPKLRGYVNNTVRSITLNIIDYDAVTGNFSGRLLNRKSSLDYNLGKICYGKVGEVIRFYDDTGVDYIDFMFEANNYPTTDISGQYISIQLFPSLSLDDQLLLLASCQFDTINNIITQVKDLRQFGNISEKDLSTSALNYIHANDRLIQENGVIRGFDDISIVGDGSTLQVSNGGVALVNGKLIHLNNQDIILPPLREVPNYAILWALCANEKSEYELIPLLDAVNDVNYNSSGQDRQLLVYSVQVGSASKYYISAIFFKDLIQQRKDLTPIRLVKVDATRNDSGASNKVPYVDYSSSIEDCRRFINDEGLNNTFVWSEKYGVDTDNGNDRVANGYFHNFNSMKSWINNYGGISNTVKIRGTVTVSNSDYFSDIINPVTFEGDGSDAVINVTSGLSVGSLTTFKNVKIRLVGETYTYIYVNNNNTFENVVFESVSFSTPIRIFVSRNTSDASYNKFNNCTFPIMYGIDVDNYNEFNNCTFNYFYNEDNNCISIKNHNKFENCTFSKYGANLYCFNSDVGSTIEGIDYNTFNKCIFDGTIISNNDLFDLNSFNVISNCNFINDITVSNIVLNLSNLNVIENIVFGNENNASLANISSSTNFIYAVKENKFKNIKLNDSINEGSNSIYLSQNGNIIDGLVCNTLSSVDAGINVYANNTLITNCFINYLRTKNGIDISLGNNNIVISNNIINYQYSGTVTSLTDKVKSDLGGCIYIEADEQSIDGILIEKNKLSQNLAFNSSTPEACSNTITPPVGSYNCPPLICLRPIGNDRYIKNIVIEKNEFIGDDQDNNVRYAAIAIVNSNSNFNNVTNVSIKDNASIMQGSSQIGYNGLIIAGTNNSTTSISLLAENINIINNRLSYISYYFASTDLSNHGILIEGNTCIMITSYNKEANNLGVLTEVSIGNAIIDNNYVESINVLTGTN